MIRKAVIVVLTLVAAANVGLWFGSYRWPTGYHFDCPVEFPERPPGFKGGYAWSWQLHPGRVRFSYDLHNIPTPLVGVGAKWEVDGLGFSVSYVSRVVTTTTSGFPNYIRSPLPTSEHHGARSLSLTIPLWMPLLLFAACPTIAFIRGPVRRWRRRKRGECVACGYNLTGNVSGVCPECGTPR